MANMQAVSMVFKFPLVDLEVRVNDAQAGLEMLSTAELSSLLAFGADSTDDDVIVHKLLEALSGDAELQLARQEYASAYNSLSARLRNHRGYGLDGDEPAEAQFDRHEVAQWCKECAPRCYRSYLLGLCGGDIAFSQAPNGKWTWSIRVPTVVLGQAKAGMRSGPCRTRQEAEMKAIEVLQLERLFGQVPAQAA